MEGGSGEHRGAGRVASTMMENLPLNCVLDRRLPVALTSGEAALSSCVKNCKDDKPSCVVCTRGPYRRLSVKLFPTVREPLSPMPCLASLLADWPIGDCGRGCCCMRIPGENEGRSLMVLRTSYYPLYMYQLLLHGSPADVAGYPQH